MTQTPVISKTPRWVKITLTLSLALNLLVAGAVGASMFWSHSGLHGKGPHDGLARPAAMKVAGRHLMWKLPRERRRELFKIIRQHRRAMRPELNVLADKRLELAKLLATPTPSQEEIDKSLSSVKDAETALHRKAGGLVKAFIGNLTPQERRLYAKILQNPPRRRWFGKPRHN